MFAYAQSADDHNNVSCSNDLLAVLQVHCQAAVTSVVYE